MTWILEELKGFPIIIDNTEPSCFMVEASWRFSSINEMISDEVLQGKKLEVMLYI